MNIPKASATTTTITTILTLSSYTVNPGDTLIIESSANVHIDNLVNNGNVIVRGLLSTANIQNNRIFLVVDSPDDPQGGVKGYLEVTNSFRNLAQGQFSIDTGSYAVIYNVDNYGIVTNYSKENYIWSGFHNLSTTATLNNYGYIDLNGPSPGGSSIGTINNFAGARFTLYNGVVFQNKGALINNYGTISVGKSSLLDNMMYSGSAIAGTIINNPEGLVSAGTYTYADIGNEVGTRFVNLGTVQLDTHSTFHNFGTFQNSGNKGILRTLFDSGNPSTSGVYNNGAGGKFTGEAGSRVENSGSFQRECNDMYSNVGTFTGNPIQNNCSAFPVTHMQDTTATVGSVTYLGRQINSEYVNNTSQLIGDKIDSITLRLQRVGSPPGTFQVGIFNANLTPKKSFEIRSTSTLSTAFQDYEFKLPNNELYTIQSGDRIGIKYNGGDTSNAISVMTDRDFSDPFDSNKSYRTRYESSWIVSYGEDMYMILKQTHG